MSIRYARLVGVATLTLLVAACVTVNLYFPAAQVEKTAEEIVKDVYHKDGQTKKPDNSSSLIRYLARLTTVGTAHAADATTVSNANIRAIKDRMRQRHTQLRPFYAQGRIGIGRDSLIAIKNTGGLPLNQVAQLKRLVQAENGDRQQLYREVAAALNLQPSQVSQVREVFAKTFRDQAEPGWLIQEPGGAWRKR